MASPEPQPATEATAEEVLQEDAALVDNGLGPQAVVELTEDMLDPVADLPLDEDLVEILPTVVEEPENEAKEQKALLEESVEEVVGGEQAEQIGDTNGCKTDQCDEIGSKNAEHVEQPESATDPDHVGNTEEDVVRTESDQHEVELQKTGEVGELAVTASEISDPNASNTTPEHRADNAGEDEDQGKTTKLVTPPEAAQEPSDHADPTKELADATETTEQPADSERTAGDDTQLQAMPDDAEKHLEASTAPESSDSQETAELAEGDVQVRKTTTEPEEGARETSEEDSKEKKKRKRSKEERKKKKSLEEKEATQEEKSSKPRLTHVRGGFSCGWVGPMLQLLGTMKKLDEFKECHGKRYTPKGHEYGQPEITDTALEPQQEEEPVQMLDIPEAAIRAPPGEGCPRCGGAVFEAERMKSRFRSYHKPCFNCKACHRILDSTLACDGPDKDVYCKLCYAKKYGPKGYGFGGGKSFLQSDIITAESPQSKPEWVKLDRTTIKPTEGCDGCPRCGGAVFAAEMMMSKGQEWHMSCFSCRDCKRPLDSTIACDGPDKEIYCRLDYAKRFGPKGFGFGHAPTLVSFVYEDDQSQTTGQTTASTAPTRKTSMGSKAAPGEGCPRCDFAVFAAETMLHNGKAYHRHCFSCGECSRSLDSTNTCSGPQNELLCRSCYGKLYGPHGVGYGQGAGVLSMG